MAHPIQAAQDALTTLVAARTAYADVAVTAGGPTESEDIRFDMFYLNDVIVPQDAWQFIGGQTRRVNFLLGFTIVVYKYGDDEHATRARCLDLLEDFMATVKANPTLSSTIQQTGDVTGTFASLPTRPQEWGALFTGSLFCQSLLY